MPLWPGLRNSIQESCGAWGIPVRLSLLSDRSSSNLVPFVLNMDRSVDGRDDRHLILKRCDTSGIRGHAREHHCYFGGNFLNMLLRSFASFWMFLSAFEDRSSLSVPRHISFWLWLSKISMVTLPTF